ncbi:MAG: hypothetical protein WC732_07075 [Candidatus Omnitrophota bacterium]
MAEEKRTKKGDHLICVPCGREIIVGTAGSSQHTIWCCGKPMATKRRLARKKASLKKEGRK